MIIWTKDSCYVLGYLQHIPVPQKGWGRKNTSPGSGTGGMLSITWKYKWEVFWWWVPWHCSLLLGARVAAKREYAVLISSVAFVLNYLLTYPCPAVSKKWGRMASRRYLFRNKSRKPYFKQRVLSLFSQSSRMKFLFGPFSFQQNSSPNS